MIIQNPNLAEIVNILVIGAFLYGAIIMIMILLMKYLFDYIHAVEIKLIAQTSPEHKALTYEYYRRVMQERQTQEEKNRIDNMFKDE